MLPPQLVSVYHQYKQDTDSVAAWLASTARACGYPADLLSSKTWNVLHPRIARLKGKQRKQAMNSASAAIAPKGTPYLVALDDFLPLANFIAQHQNPVIKVPDAFSKIIDRVITLRSGFADMMNNEGIEPDDKSNEKHGYFIGILEAVRTALRPRMSTAAAAKAMEAENEANSQGADENLANRFSALTVDDPSQAFLDDFLAPGEELKQAEYDHVVYKTQPSALLEDILFSFSLLMNDLYRIRQRIIWIWSDYTKGGFDLAASAVASNTAIALARGMIDDAAHLFTSREGGLPEIMRGFYLMQCLSKGYGGDEILTADGYNFEGPFYDLSNKTCYIAFNILTAFLRPLSPNAVPLYKEGTYGYYDAKSDRTTKSGEEKFNEDKIVLLEFFTELMTVIRGIPYYPIDEEFLRAMKELDKTRTVSMSAVFSAQVYLDIHHTLRNDTRQCFAVAMQQAGIIKTHIEKYLEFHQKLKIENWPPSNDEQLRNLIRTIELMGQDPVHQLKSKLWKKQGQNVPQEMEMHRILIYSPIFSGLYVFQLRTKMYEIGITAANAWGSIVCCAHLYNALQQERLVTGEWKDMEVALSLLGDLSFWVGGEPPRDLQDCFQKFCLQMGVTAAAFTNNRRRNTPIASRAGPRGIKEGAPVSLSFAAVIAGAVSEIDWTTEQVESILSHSQFKMEGSLGDGTLVMEKIDDPQELKDKVQSQKKKGKGGKKKKKNKTGVAKKSAVREEGITPEKLTEALLLCLQSETLELAFPYTVLHRQCWMLLRNAKDKCDAVLREIHGPAYMEKETELPFLVGYCLSTALGSTSSPDKRVLEAAAAAVNDMIEAGSSQIVTLVVNNMSLGIAIEGENESEDRGED